MSILTLLKRKSKQQAVIEINSPFAGFSGSAYGNAAFRAAVDAIGRHTAKLQAHTENKQLAALLNNAPNAYMSGFDLIYKTAAAFYTHNNAFMLLDRAERGGIIAVYPLNPQSVEFMPGSDGALYLACLFNDGKRVTFPYVANGYSDMLYESTSMDEALDYLSRFARLSEELGSSEKAFKEINAYEEANAAYIYIEQYLALWKKKRDELEAILGEGGTLNEEQAAFMSKYDTLMDFFGEDFLKDVDLTEDGSEIAGSLGEGIENRLKSYDFTGTGSAVADSLDEAVRNPLGANSPATRFIPIGVDIAEGLAAGITSGTSLVTNAIVALANAAVAAAKEALQIHSPSRVFRDEIGAMAMAGFGEGVIAQTEAEGRVIRNAARYLTDEASGGVMAGRNAYNTYNYTTDAPISFEGATFAIREEHDIHSLAQEIASLIKREQAGKGFRR